MTSDVFCSALNLVKHAQHLRLERVAFADQALDVSDIRLDIGNF